MADEILTVAEVIQLPKVAEKTVYTMAHNAEMLYFKVLGQWCLCDQYFDTLMGNQVAGAAAPEEPTPKGKMPTRKGVRR